MTRHLLTFPIAALVLCAAPLVARADANPDFDDNAKPILRMQPGLVQYVESRYDVKDTGTAKYPGDDDHPPAPPYIFRARPLGSSGPYNLRLLIQPGTPGHILGVVDITKAHLSEPGSPASHKPPAVAANRPPTPAQQPQPPSSTQQPQAPEPTADTPSGPITGSGQGAPLAPPPDPSQPH